MGGGDDKRTFWAKVSGRVDVSAGSGFWAGLAARAEAVEKGFADADVVAVDVKGLLAVEVPVEKGLLEGKAALDGATPNRDAPMFWVAAFGPSASWEDCCGAGVLSVFLLDFDCPLATLVPRMPLTLPSFRLHVLRRQAKRYSRRSWPGKRSGMSPLSWRSRDMSPLQTLHFASAPEGAVVPSSHVYH